MFQVAYKIDGCLYSYQAADEKMRDDFTQTLDSVGVKYDILASTYEKKYQICGCVFKAKDNLYTFVRPEGDAKPGMSAIGETINSFGDVELQEVIVLDTRKATVSEIREIANSLGRDKLGKLVKIWQKKLA